MRPLVLRSPGAYTRYALILGYKASFAKSYWQWILILLPWMNSMHFRILIWSCEKLWGCTLQSRTAWNLRIKMMWFPLRNPTGIDLGIFGTKFGNSIHYKLLFQVKLMTIFFQGSKRRFRSSSCSSGEPIYSSLGRRRQRVQVCSNFPRPCHYIPIVHNRPERWEELPNAVQSIPGIYSHILTFIGGPRACIGYRFSLVE